MILFTFMMGCHFEVFSVRFGRSLLGSYCVPPVAMLVTKNTKINKSCACHREITSEKRSTSR